MMNDTRACDSYCERCGNVLQPTDPAPLCLTCQLEAADNQLARDRSESAQTVTASKEGRERRRALVRRAVSIALIAISLAVIAIQAPALVRAVSPPQPLRDGTMETDGGTDACISNLWRMLADVSEGRSPAADLTCPDSGKRYTVGVADGVTTVSCPDPSAHGLKELYVRSNAKMPVAR